MVTSGVSTNIIDSLNGEECRVHGRLLTMIVKHLSEVVPERVGDFRRWYLSRAEPGHALSVRYVELTGIVPPHAHIVEETIFYVEGRGFARVGEKEIRIKPGTMLVVPPGTVHSSIREGLEPLRYLVHIHWKPGSVERIFSN